MARIEGSLSAEANMRVATASNCSRFRAASDLVCLDTVVKWITLRLE
jgi:hypothetical protein